MSPRSNDHDLAVKDLEGALLDLMSEFRRFYARAADEVSPGLSVGAFRALITVDRSGPTTVSAIAERMRLDKGLTSRHVSDLVRLGLVDRVVDGGDRRVRRLIVTDEARRRLDAVRVSYEHLLASGLVDWPVDQVARLSSLIADLAAGLHAVPAD